MREERRGGVGGGFEFLFVSAFARACVSVNTYILKDEHVDTDSTHLLRFWPKYKAACVFLLLSKINVVNGDA